MLVLTRKALESTVLCIPGFDDIEIVISEIRRARVRIAIDAPQTVRVLRGRTLKKDGSIKIEYSKESKNAKESRQSPSTNPDRKTGEGPETPTSLEGSDG